MLFLVTNKHVVAGAHTGKFFFTESDGTEPLIGKRYDIEMDNFEWRWHGHPIADIDITIMPLVPVLKEIEKAGKRVFFKALPHTLIPTTEQVNDLDAIEEVLFIGYPSGIFDQKNLMPLARRGMTATPLQIDYEGKPIFLIDASVFPGSSGSPVLICNTGGYASKGGFVVGNRVFFLGVIAEVAFREEQGQIDFVSIPTAEVPIVKTRQMIDIGVVFKASTVVEAIEDFLKKRPTS